MIRETLASMTGTCNGPDNNFTQPQLTTAIVDTKNTRKLGCRVITQEDGRNICSAASKPCPVSPEGGLHNPFIAFNSGTKNYALNPIEGLLVANDGTITQHTSGEATLIEKLVEKNGEWINGKRLAQELGYQKLSIPTFVHRIRQAHGATKKNGIIDANRPTGYRIRPYTGPQNKQ